MTTVVYNIPVHLAAAYRGRKVIVRTAEPAELVKTYAGGEVGNIVGIQLFSLGAGVNTMADWGYAVPVELVMHEPATEFPMLYRHAKLLDKHPMRVSIPAVPGFSRAVKLATSLEFVVKLELGQPDSAVLAELKEMLDFYLHQPLVGQPVDPFHGLLIAAYYGDQSTLWDIQEENPACVRYVTEDGRETIARRFTGENGRPQPIFVWSNASCAANSPGLDSFVSRLSQKLLSERAECFGCEFFERCSGYFKWPRQDYDCAGVKPLLWNLKEAAEELLQDLTLLLGSKEEALR